MSKNQKKAEFLDTLGYSLVKDPEVSLISYLEYSRLDSCIHTLNVQSSNVVMKKSKYIEELKLESSEKINLFSNTFSSLVQPSDPTCLEKISVDLLLFDVVDQTNYNPLCKGVYLYYKGRLISRMEVEFGDLFWQKFYKNRYKKASAIWDKIGIINIHEGLKPKLLMNDWKNCV